MATLYYVMDPMCSWCWAFRPVLADVVSELPEGVRIRWVMGGLAPDSDEPMPRAMQEHLQKIWKSIANQTGTRFNFDFWTRCRPRRSTWPACRAVIAARLQDEDKAPEMIYAIQKAYYLQARNPSDRDTLVALAAEIGLDRERFESDLGSPRVDELLRADFSLARKLSVQGFPTLVLSSGGRTYLISQGYAQAAPIVSRLRNLLEHEGATEG
ncbi:MAG: DsbA family protein [Gammaproteobacteria bacterium]|nr:DsbA family protein [Gammaproteobacteria bacterium]NIR82500.1 DsbA family protein [Gammaproteobacteria bacterium]NIR88496.1 DsbA family protein [Gammaproteobacteria bacterium]NIU03636.1 DsbA family protein [Gammaproteobacteria bacterium]NIV50988.1 thioredoxin domain-containing protein [Gammaproteobacteria bacterium]